MKTALLLSALFVSSLATANLFRFHLRCWASFQFHQPCRFVDGYTNKDCAKAGGKMEDEACIIPSENTVSIGVDADDIMKTNVQIDVLFGPANEREFDGVVTKAGAHSLVAIEQESDLNTACKVSINEKKASSA